MLKYATEFSCKFGRRVMVAHPDNYALSGHWACNCWNWERCVRHWQRCRRPKTNKSAERQAYLAQHGTIGQRLLQPYPFLEAVSHCMGSNVDVRQQSASDDSDSDHMHWRGRWTASTTTNASATAVERQSTICWSAR